MAREAIVWSRGFSLTGGVTPSGVASGVDEQYLGHNIGLVPPRTAGRGGYEAR